MVIVVCKQCGSDVKTKPSHLALGFGKYCSRTCGNEAARKGKNVRCFTCGKETYKPPKQLSRSKSGKFFCSKSCQTHWRNKVYIGEKHSNYVNGGTSYRATMTRSGAKEECFRCKVNDTRILAVHHIDRNRSNNSIENLMYLCHNCHHLIHQHKEEDEEMMATMV